MAKAKKSKVHKTLASAVKALKRKPAAKLANAKPVAKVGARKAVAKSGSKPNAKPRPTTPKPADDIWQATKRVLDKEHPKGMPTRPSRTRWPVEIVVGKRHRKDFGDLKDLAASIDERGTLLQPIVITTDNMLIAGERRLRAWSMTSFRDQPIPVHVVTVDSIIAGEWDENARRKDFTPEEAVAIKNEIERQLSLLAKERQRSGGKADPKAKGRAGDQAARAAGFDRRTIEKAEAVVEAAAKEPEKYGQLRERMNRTGKVDGPYKRLKVMKQAEAISNETPPLPMNGPYRTFVADVPWPGEPDDPDPAGRGRAYYPYPTMSIEKIAAMGPEIRRIVHADGGWLWFWIPNFHLVKGLHLPILEAWGFDPVALRTWRKPHFGNGQLLRGQTEQVILCRRGKPPAINLTNETTIFDGEASGEHSEKPASFFVDVEKLTPSARYCYLFAGRQLPERWDGHGDRIGKDIVAADAPVKPADNEARADDYHRRLLAALSLVQNGDVVSDAEMRAELQKNKLIKGRKPKLTEDGARRLAKLREKLTPAPTAEHGVRKTLPNRDAALIRWAEDNGHVVSMTIDHAAGLRGERVGSCACGWTHRQPRLGDAGDASDPDIVLERIAASKVMDDAITAHWSDMRAREPDTELASTINTQPTADEPAADTGEAERARALPAPPPGTEDGLDIPDFLRRTEPKNSVKDLAPEDAAAAPQI